MLFTPYFIIGKFIATGKDILNIDINKYGGELVAIGPVIQNGNDVFLLNNSFQKILQDQPENVLKMISVYEDLDTHGDEIDKIAISKGLLEDGVTYEIIIGRIDCQNSYNHHLFKRNLRKYYK